MVIIYLLDSALQPLNNWGLVRCMYEHGFAIQ